MLFVVVERELPSSLITIVDISLKRETSMIKYQETLRQG